MGISRRSAVCSAAMVLVLCFAWGALATQATVLTNLGRVADGMLTGLAPVISLRVPAEVSIVGPLQQFDIPLASIRQISLDFPRLVIETDTSVIIGPFSAFGGINEILTLTTEAASIDIPLTSIRAIGLHGGGLRALPRVWMGDHFLSARFRPLVPGEYPGMMLPVTGNVQEAIPVAEDPGQADDSRLIWNTITPGVAVQEPDNGLPWWLGLVGVAALMALFYFISAGQTP